jgi:hypothetical protein
MSCVTSIKRGVDQETFTPYIEATVRFGVESAQDAKIHGVSAEEFFKTIFWDDFSKALETI